MWSSCILLLVSTFTFVAPIAYEPNDQLSNRTFPADFLFGVATAAYQIEGAWNEEGKGENIWDHFLHENPALTNDSRNGDVASDSYHKYLEDIALMKEVGVNFYRFSIAWTRIFPTGLPNNLNRLGLAYYNNLINALVENDITPVVTLYHWDLPQYLQDIGGFLNPNFIDYYLAYARVIFENFGDRVPYFTTFNEPKQTCLAGYSLGIYAPGVNKGGIGEYQCAYTLLKAHAAAYHMYDEEYRPRFNGQIGIVIDSNFVFTESDDPKDVEAQTTELEFMFGLYANPIFGENGNYPQVVIDRVRNRSTLQGFSSSRLIEFTDEEVEYIKGTSDYLGLNHYSSDMVAYEEKELDDLSFAGDKGTTLWANDVWPKSAVTWEYVVPEGFRGLLNWVKDHYNNPTIIVTENGYVDNGQIDDPERISYYKRYLSNLLFAIYEDNVNVIGYTAWSIIDNFEWLSGYTARLGLYYVDFEDDERPRSPKTSAGYYKNIIATRCILEADDGLCET